MTPQHHLPADIERTSLSIITAELEALGLTPPPETAAVVKRVIHTTADFDYAKNLRFTPGAVEAAVRALHGGVTIVTDTNMALAGVNKAALKQLNGTVRCFMADPDVAAEAEGRGVTRAIVSMERAATLAGPVIFAIGNAPTALIRLYEMMQKGEIHPDFIIGTPVGFVNVVESKELICQSSVPCIVARGRKGGSNIAAAVCNALMYQVTRTQKSGK